MKNNFSHLPQRSQRRFGSQNAAGRATVSGNTAAGTGLRPEDGYDWLRRIKPVRTDQRAGQ